MKKVLLIILVLLIYVFISHEIEKKYVIPAEAIRIRILANSNTTEDQNIKREVKDKIEPYLYNLLSNSQSKLEAKNTIINNMESIEKVIETSLLNRQTYSVNFGKNYFPEKEYRGVLYEEGYYDSLLIKLGDGLGDNWWCVLFPPLCLLEGNVSEDVEYSSFVAELMEKYF